MSKEKIFRRDTSDREFFENHSVMAVSPLGEKLYQVQSETHPDKSYVVDMLGRNCNCMAYRYGGACKHLAKVIRVVERPTPEDLEMATNRALAEVY